MTMFGEKVDKKQAKNKTNNTFRKAKMPDKKIGKKYKTSFKQARKKNF